MQFAFLWALARVGVVITDAIAYRIARRFPKFETRASHVLSDGDCLCLLCNSVTETLFTIFVVTLDLPALTRWFPLNCIALFVADDLLYAPFHYTLHHPMVYKFVHARHHRVRHPSEGYSHASMEHPLEMLGALLLHGMSIWMLWPLLDLAGVCLHLWLKALGACLNHYDHDVVTPVYRAIHHRRHHSKLKVNFAQSVFLFDRCIGTFDSR